MERHRLFKIILVAAGFCLLFLVPKSATSSEVDIFIFSMESAVGAGGLLSSVGNIYYAANGEKAKEFYITSGWVFCFLNVIAGTIVLGATEGRDDFWLGVGISHLALGAVDIGFAIWSSSLPERVPHEDRNLFVSPVLIPSTVGGPAFGISLNFLNW